MQHKEYSITLSERIFYHTVPIAYYDHDNHVTLTLYANQAEKEMTNDQQKLQKLQSLYVGNWSSLTV